MLVDFINTHQSRLVARTRAMSAARHSPLVDSQPSEAMPLFLDHLKAKLRDDHSASSATMGAAHRGGELLGRGYSVGQVVHDYGALCQAITELAGEEDAPISTDEFRRLNGCLDDAIAEAVTEYVRIRDQALAAGETERSGVLVHELRNKLSAAQFAFDAIRSGRAPVGGAVASVVARNLAGIGTLINRTQLEVRLDSRLTHSTRVKLDSIVEEAREEAALEATRRGVMLSVARVDPRIYVSVDPQVLGGVLGNLLQNALKFTRHNGLVRVFAGVVSGRAEVRVEDECGGLPPGKVEELFGAFKQRGSDRTGLGLGLFICQKGMDACGGSIRVRDVPKLGCVFTLDLPMVDPP